MESNKPPTLGVKVVIGSRVPPRTSMFEHRDGTGIYWHTMPPILGDAEILQAALLQASNPKPPGLLRRIFQRSPAEHDPSLLRRIFDWITVA